MSETKKIELPSVLSFERKIETSDALLYSGNWGEPEDLQTQEWMIIPIIKRQNRSTQSAYGIDDEKKSKPNPVSSDSDDANLPHSNDTLRVSFSIRFIGNLGMPYSCDNPDFTKAISQAVNSFKRDIEGLESLAIRYAYNVANGRFLWRNRVCAEEIIISVKAFNKAPLIFNAYDFSLNNFEDNKEDNKLIELKDLIFTGLNSNEKSFTLLEIDAYVKLGNGQHIFPSQEMNMGEKKKVLFKLPVNGKECAAIHNVKIGNAIRTIDDWYNNAEFPIAVEPYGSVTQMGQAYRKNRKEGDLYSLMIDWLNEKSVTNKDKAFVVANIIRGGVFGGKDE